jgi:hypothetical protein
MPRGSRRKGGGLNLAEIYSVLGNTALELDYMKDSINYNSKAIEIRESDLVFLAYEKG